jgi:hypothetical protein
VPLPDFVIAVPQTQADPESPPGPIGPGGSTLWTAEHQQHPYTQYIIKVDYLWDNGVLQLPMAEPAEGTLVECEVVHHCAPYGKKVVSWTATRAGVKPILPDPTPQDDNEELEGFVVSPLSSVLQADGVTKMYKVTGVYTYILKTPVPPSSGFQFAAVPFDQTPKASNRYESSDFSTNLI